MHAEIPHPTQKSANKKSERILVANLNVKIKPGGQHPASSDTRVCLPGVLYAPAAALTKVKSVLPGAAY